MITAGSKEISFLQLSGTGFIIHTPGQGLCSEVTKICDEHKSDFIFLVAFFFSFVLFVLIEKEREAKEGGGGSGRSWGMGKNTTT